MKTIFIALISLIVISCSDDKFRKVETLETGFRVLAIKAVSPELSAGGNTNLQVLISDLGGGGRTVTGTVEGCIDPGISKGATPSCQDDPNKTTATYNIDTTTLTGAAAASYVGWGPNVLITLNSTSTAYFATQATKNQYNGVPYLVLFKFTDGSKQVVTYKRLLITNRGTLNANPTLTQLNFDGSAASGIPGNGTTVSSNASGAETYTYINVDDSSETKTEALAMAWYTNHGTFDLPKSSTTENVKYKSDENPASIVFVSIVRDERGGVEAVTYKSP